VHFLVLKLWARIIAIDPCFTGRKIWCIAERWWSKPYWDFMNLLLIGTLWGQIFLVKGGQHLRARRAGVCSVVTISLWAPKTLGNPPPRSPIAVYKTTFSFEISEIWPPWSRPKKNCLKRIAISSWMHISHVQPMCITLLPNMLDLIHELKPSYHQTIWTLLQTSPLASNENRWTQVQTKKKKPFYNFILMSIINHGADTSMFIFSLLSHTPHLLPNMH